MAEELFDVIIIGAGPAGITAAIYAARKRLKTLVIGTELGGQVNWSSDVENYIGYHLLSGPDLVEKFKEHLADYPVRHLEGVTVTDVVIQKDQSFVVSSTGGDFRGWSVIAASGKIPRSLGVPGEKDFIGRGVTFCATCDGPLYKNKTVAVIGGGNVALDTAISLRKFCPRVFIVSIDDAFKGDMIMREQVLHDAGVTVLFNTSVRRIEGDAVVRHVVVSGTDGVEQILDVSGVFVEIGSEPSISYLRRFVDEGLLHVSARGEIVINGDTTTGVPGLFAAGDVSSVFAKQMIVAAGEGAKATLSAFAYLVKSGHVPGLSA